VLQIVVKCETLLGDHSKVCCTVINQWHSCKFCSESILTADSQKKKKRENKICFVDYKWNKSLLPNWELPVATSKIAGLVISHSLCSAEPTHYNSRLADPSIHLWQNLTLVTTQKTIASPLPRTLKNKILPAVTMLFSVTQTQSRKGKKSPWMVANLLSFAAFTTLTLESWPTQASLFPEAEKLTPWTQPPANIKQ